MSPSDLTDEQLLTATQTYLDYDSHDKQTRGFMNDLYAECKRRGLTDQLDTGEEDY